MQEYKLLAPYFSAHLAAYPDDVKEKAGKGLVFWATDRESYIGLAYNTNSVQGSAVPKNFDGLLNPELKGRLAIGTGGTFGEIIGAMLKVKGDGFVKKLKAREIAFSPWAVRRLGIRLPRERSKLRR